MTFESGIPRQPNREEATFNELQEKLTGTISVTQADIDSERERLRDIVNRGDPGDSFVQLAAFIIENGDIAIGRFVEHHKLRDASNSQLIAEDSATSAA